MFHNHQYIPNATFDTGCSHSLISAKSLNKVNLIGMHIIKQLYTKIFSAKGQIFLVAKKSTPLADTELDNIAAELKEQIELLSE